MSVTVASARGVRVQAPAKLNLLLHVLAREASGFHAIESLFVKLALHDLVTIRTDARASALRCTGPSLPMNGLGAPEANLAWRAAETYRAATGFPEAWDIAIEKRIPVGGGLGGGSSDAAAVLRGLNAVAPTPLSPAQLVAMAGRIGSDVPFLVSDAVLAWSWGRGDRLLALPVMPAADVALVTSAEGVDTGAAYGALAASRAAADTAPAATMYPSSAFSSWPRIVDLAVNDFEAVVPALHAGVKVGLRQVRSWAAEERSVGRPAIGLLSGSGATCYLLTPAVSGGSPGGGSPGGGSPGGGSTVGQTGREAAAELTAAGLRVLHTQTAEAIVPPELIF